MARYTDIDLLFDKVEETVWYHINKNGELVDGANSETDIPLYKHSDIMRVLAEAPEADVAPRSEGKWGFKGTAYGCSLCGHGVIAPIYNFCPNCGAKMGGNQ